MTPWPGGVRVLVERVRGVRVERVRVLGVRVLAVVSWAVSAEASGIQAPLSTGRFAAFLMVGLIVWNLIPSHGRASAWPADAWASSGRAMLIGIAKPMPWLPPATAVLMPITAPVGSRSGPPLLPGLIAVSVWMRLERVPFAMSMLRPWRR